MFRQMLMAVSVAVGLALSTGAGAVEAPPQSPLADSSVTTGSVTVGGKVLAYRAVTGHLVVKSDAGKPAARVFYVAYFKTGVEAAEHRPITFFYNGGPGAASAWLHMAAFGPRRVALADHASTPAAPYRVVNNEYSLLDATDMVFIDAPDTGYSRLITAQEGGDGSPANAYGIDADANLFARFITGFLGKYERWNSPKLLCGESYGTTRSVVLGRLLQQRYNVKVNGIVLISALLNFTTSVDNARFTPGLDIAYPLALPTYAVAAWFHHRMDDPPADVEKVLEGAERYAMTDYVQALHAGSALDAVTRSAVAAKLSHFTGLPVHDLLRMDLRVSGAQFRARLLAASGLTIGRLDARFAGPNVPGGSGEAGYDPANSAMKDAVSTAFNDYVRRVLDYRTDLEYRINYPPVQAVWDWQHQPSGFGKHTRVIPNVMIDLADEMRYDPGLKVMFNMGYYDLATPYFAAEYVIRHLEIPDSLRGNISYRLYSSGHMIYSNVPELAKLHHNIASFIASVSAPSTP